MQLELGEVFSACGFGQLQAAVATGRLNINTTLFKIIVQLLQESTKNVKNIAQIYQNFPKKIIYFIKFLKFWLLKAQN